MLTGRFGIDIPQGGTTPGAGQQLVRFTSEAERRGFTSLWVTDPQAPGALSPLETLSVAAVSTSSASLGVAVLITPLRSPIHLARELATVDRLSDGRLIAGVGIGNDRAAPARHGLTVNRRVTEFERGIVLLRELLEQQTASSDGPWNLDQERRPLEPVQRPGPPIWFGARTPPALERTARLGDGFIGAGSMSTRDFETALDLLRPHIEERPDFPIAKRVYLHVGAKTNATWSAIRDWFGSHYGNPNLAEKVALCAEPGEVIDALTHLLGLGVQHLVLSPVLDDYDQMVALSESVLPHVTAS
ncbi:alkanesulfonate monooxygenase SsuD/methylene tetrahydromethanopterin reductase-like flavin-dependent oxidoreductase (luciferase family) [Antricoccus suffuscus]|uniref:Alkanesulfonate monooxygenase SsuD/methylene tetrahydromethanopterin reductase-like flavin-dependent oxidoreductase (Luciferase family) n=1 Tax=Antricoccus suffuscus TaxID=1629062 RepID=A0A2T0ZXJ2_9ACTN|nr:LLM class flavin-dependent oxidoreductase [Antricoccus suffuscus]PRZ41070.1 alkanesulfonate monooxygenase SsuD/methylene tetrahydromethanopterin reductase-like flavin-dependent oxidoreductase (luciferase family) [Antricoccus suffuscus]